MPKSASASRRPARTIAKPQTRPVPKLRSETARLMPGSTCRSARAPGWSAAALSPVGAERPIERCEGTMIAHDDRVPAGPTGAGIGLRAPHVAEILATRPAVAFLEVHAENYMGGGPAPAALERLRCDYPFSLHGVGLSLGGSDPLDTRHLARLARLVERLDPVFVSE